MFKFLKSLDELLFEFIDKRAFLNKLFFNFLFVSGLYIIYNFQYYLYRWLGVSLTLSRESTAISLEGSNSLDFSLSLGGESFPIAISPLASLLALGLLSFLTATVYWSASILYMPVNILVIVAYSLVASKLFILAKLFYFLSLYHLVGVTLNYETETVRMNLYPVDFEAPYSGLRYLASRAAGYTFLPDTCILFTFYHWFRFRFSGAFHRFFCICLLYFFRFFFSTFSIFSIIMTGNFFIVRYLLQEGSGITSIRTFISRKTPSLLILGVTLLLSWYLTLPRIIFTLFFAFAIYLVGDYRRFRKHGDFGDKSFTVESYFNFLWPMALGREPNSFYYLDSYYHLFDYYRSHYYRILNPEDFKDESK